MKAKRTALVREVLRDARYLVVDGDLFPMKCEK